MPKALKKNFPQAILELLQFQCYNCAVQPPPPHGGDWPDIRGRIRGGGVVVCPVAPLPYLVVHGCLLQGVRIRGPDC